MTAFAPLKPSSIKRVLAPAFRATRSAQAGGAGTDDRNVATHFRHKAILAHGLPPQAGRIQGPDESKTRAVLLHEQLIEPELPLIRGCQREGPVFNTPRRSYWQSGNPINPPEA